MHQLSKINDMKQHRLFSNTSLDKTPLYESKRSMAIKGILSSIEVVSVKELPRTQMFGSTDRKGYTVQITLSCLGEVCHCFFDIQPWTDNAERVVEFGKERAKEKFANEIYDALFSEINFVYAPTV